MGAKYVRLTRRHHHRHSDRGQASEDLTEVTNSPVRGLAGNQLMKREFFCEEVKYLGYVIGQNGLKIDPDKIAPILEYPPPRWYVRFLGDIS